MSSNRFWPSVPDDPVSASSSVIGGKRSLTELISTIAQGTGADVELSNLDTAELCPSPLPPQPLPSTTSQSNNSDAQPNIEQARKRQATECRYSPLQEHRNKYAQEYHYTPSTSTSRQPPLRAAYRHSFKNRAQKDNDSVQTPIIISSSAMSSATASTSPQPRLKAAHRHNFKNLKQKDNDSVQTPISTASSAMSSEINLAGSPAIERVTTDSFFERKSPHPASNALHAPPSKTSKP